MRGVVCGRPLYGPRHWAGVPGVRYPEPVAVLPPTPPAGWLLTREVAARLQVTQARALRLLEGAGVRCVLLRGGQRAWEPQGVRRVAAGLPQVVEALPEGWCGAAEACGLLGCSRSSLGRLVGRVGLRTRRVSFRGRVCVLFERDVLRRLAAARGE